ncbi:CAP domain-containing protein [Paracoccus aerodenitrificans]|uniref:CAP domain-containing protein n=1 Tax=Paracoccus aerodenitrificans TaxID=3017781 RepID=UPI0022EFE25B|nr:CAP domain-containing protein [Paracoccus aerodenitrificans]WBU62991.1 CAP domain-containing protein [Paracoccus aerodenitrificans]
MSASALSYTNGLRARHGLEPLKANRSLQLAARAHACDMASFGWMSHRGSHSAGPAERVKAVGYRPRITAENIAAGNFDLNRTLTEWSRSPNHRNNILLPSISEFGIGHALSADGKSHFWTAVYADPAG